MSTSISWADAAPLEVSAASLTRRTPDFFIVGLPKSGTTAMYEMLRRHPQVFMPELKEPMFLATDLRWRFQPPMAGPLPESLDEYLDLFEGASAEQRIGEATVLYLYSQTAAASIAAVNPAARIVAIFREPAAFLRSFHLQLIQGHQENQRDLRRAIALEAERRQGRHIPRRAHRPQDLLYSLHVSYADQLRRYRERFPADQILTLIYDDYREDNEATIRRVTDFLGLDASVPLEALEANPTVRLRSALVDDAVHRFSVGRDPVSKVVKGVIKAVVPQGARRRALHGVQSSVLYAAPPPADEELMHELRVWLKPEVEAFSELLGRDLVQLWGYDRL